VKPFLISSFSFSHSSLKGTEEELRSAIDYLIRKVKKVKNFSEKLDPLHIFEYNPFYMGYDDGQVKENLRHIKQLGSFELQAKVASFIEDRGTEEILQRQRENIEMETDD